MSHTIDLPARRRVARLTLLAVALAAIALGLLVLAGWIAFGQGSHSNVGLLPFGISYHVPAIALLTAAGLGTAAFFVGFAALHAAAAIRILARDRRIPQPLSEPERQMRRLVLHRAGETVLGLDEEPDRPPTALPDRDDGTTSSRLRLTVLVPAHDEALTIGAALSSPHGQTRPPDRVLVIADNCTDDTAEVARRLGADVYSTVANTDKKAGGLNQALKPCCPQRTAVTC